MIQQHNLYAEINRRIFVAKMMSCYSAERSTNVNTGGGIQLQTKEREENICEYY